ncbi:MAG: CBS domain-containing protein [Coleofasciculus sp. G1-WW12-02]|uniref:CBS domain-containing protein n=1 Tax=Coleofasciculus sp. G1-WW12-02 TaxID=3068483 RepID=UPI0032F8C610
MAKIHSITNPVSNISKRSSHCWLLAVFKQISREQWKSYRVEDIMKPVQKDLTARPDETMSNVLQKMQNTGMGRVLVTNNGDLQGIITASDVSRWLHRRQELGMRDE